MTDHDGHSRTHTRRPRYPGRNPRQFHEKYKEHAPALHPDTVAQVRASGKTPAGMHLPIMVGEVLQCLTPGPGETVVDCTLGGGGHAQALLERIVPNGRLIGLDVDPLELPRTEARLRALGYGPDVFIPRHGNFAGLPQALAELGITTVDAVLADLGVSSMQIDNPDRGFTWKGVGPLDMRMNPARGEPASALLARLREDELAALLVEYADEPYAELIARLLIREKVETSHAAERVIRMGLNAAKPGLSRPEVKLSVRRTFQALRIAVNGELSVLEALLRSLPDVLAPGGRVAILTFHSGEDRRVKKAFQTGRRAGVYAAISDGVIQSTVEETRANRRASSAKLRWAVRA